MKDDFWDQGKRKTTESLPTGCLFGFLLLASLADNNKRTEALRDEYYKQVQILNLTTPSGKYHAVAGEVEAYDVQARRRSTAEEKTPDLT